MGFPFPPLSIIFITDFTKEQKNMNKGFLFGWTKLGHITYISDKQVFCKEFSPHYS